MLPATASNQKGDSMIPMFHGLLLSLIVSPAQPILVVDYILKLEMSHETETKIGDKEATTESDVRTVELLIDSERRFQGTTTWGNGKERLTVKGKLSEAKDSQFELNIEFGHFVKTGHFIPEVFGGPRREVEKKDTGLTTVRIKLGEPAELGGTVSKIQEKTLDEDSVTTEKKFFRVTVMKDDSTD
jgi:hypothetical protein